MKNSKGKALKKLHLVVLTDFCMIDFPQLDFSKRKGNAEVTQEDIDKACEIAKNVNDTDSAFFALSDIAEAVGVEEPVWTDKNSKAVDFMDRYSHSICKAKVLTETGLLDFTTNKKPFKTNGATIFVNVMCKNAAVMALDKDSKRIGFNLMSEDNLVFFDGEIRNTPEFVEQYEGNIRTIPLPYSYDVIWEDQKTGGSGAFVETEIIEVSFTSPQLSELKTAFVPKEALTVASLEDLNASKVYRSDKIKTMKATHCEEIIYSYNGKLYRPTFKSLGTLRNTWMKNIKHVAVYQDFEIKHVKAMENAAAKGYDLIYDYTRKAVAKENAITSLTDNGTSLFWDDIIMYEVSEPVYLIEKYAWKGCKRGVIFLKTCDTRTCDGVMQASYYQDLEMYEIFPITEYDKALSAFLKHAVKAVNSNPNIVWDKDNLATEYTVVDPTFVTQKHIGSDLTESEEKNSDMSGELAEWMISHSQHFICDFETVSELETKWFQKGKSSLSLIEALKTADVYIDPDNGKMYAALTV